MIGNIFNRNNVHFSLILLVCTTIVTSTDDCRWTGCQSNVWTVTGCDRYNRTEKARRTCDDGFEYHCCAKNDPTEEFLANHCWWSECRPKDNLSDSGCPSHSVQQSRTRSCAEGGGGGGDQYMCCMKKSALPDYYNDFKITDRYKNVAKYIYGTMKKHKAFDFDYRNTSLHEQKKADENKSYKESTKNATKHILSENRDVKTEFHSRDTSSEPKTNQKFGQYYKRQIPIYAEYWDSDDDGSDDDSDYGADVGPAEDRDQPIEDVETPGRYCDGDKRIVGYYTSWSPKEVTSEMIEKVTHVIYSFVIPQADGTIDFDSPASKERLKRLMELRKSYPQVKIMFAVGGGASSQSFSSITASSETRGTLTASIVKLADDNGFDGVDIDWEFPVVTVGAVEGAPEDKDNYVLLMKELREALDAHATETGRTDPYLVSFAGPPGQWALDPGFDLPGLMQYADFVNVMAYDYFGVWGSSQWSSYTGPPAPLYPGTPSDFPVDFSHSNVDWTVGYYVEKIGAPDKLNMGVPFYGWYWNNVGDPINADDQMWRKARPVDGIYQGGATQWRDVQKDHLSDGRFQQMFHEECKTPYAWNQETSVFLGYEDQRSLGFKVGYAAEKNVGGLMVWALDMDDDDLTLLNTLHAAATSCEKSDPGDEGS